MDENNQTYNIVESPLEQTLGGEEEKHPGGRPSTINDLVIAKLVGALQQGLSVRNACNYAGISTDAYYRKFNSDEEFRGQMTQAKLFLLVVASDTLLKALVDPMTPLALRIRLSIWYIERTEPEVFEETIKTERSYEPRVNRKTDLVPMEYPKLIPHPLPTLEPL